jgi:hypothetical protein
VGEFPKFGKANRLNYNNFGGPAGTAIITPIRRTRCSGANAHYRGAQAAGSTQRGGGGSGALEKPDEFHVTAEASKPGAQS